jgi:hypothetical protein
MACLVDRLLRYREISGKTENDTSARRPKPKGRRRKLTLESLEQRVTPSGETVTATFNVIPVQKTVRVSFDATIDSPLVKGIDRVFNQGSVSGSGFATIRTDASQVAGTGDPLVTPVERAPMVSGVFLNSSGWTQAFRNNLQAQGLGDSTLGYSVPTGGQMTSIPWPNLDRVSVRFTSNVNVAAGSLTIFGTYNADYAVNPTVLSYDPTTFTATWALPGPIVADGLRLILSSAGVSNVGANARLDGDWLDGTAVFPSGNGASGSDFSFRFNVVPGDVNRNGISNSADLLLVRQTIGGTQVTSDLNGDGTVTETDFDLGRSLIGKGLLVIPPGGRAGTGWVPSSGTPTPPNPPGVRGTNVTAAVEAFLQVDVDRDGRADPGDTLRYIVAIRNFSTAPTSATLTDTLDPYMTLVPGSVRLSPVPFDDHYTMTSGTTLTIAAAQGVLANDVDPNTPPQALSVVTAGTNNQFDQVTVNPDGSFTFTPATGVKGARTFLYTVRNISGMDAVGTAIIDVTNTAPVLAGIESTSLAYTQGNAPTPVTSTLTVSDADDLNLAGASVAITGGTYVNGQDVLSFTNQNGITGNFNTSTGVLTLSGSSSVANYQTALRSVRYSNMSSSPVTTPRQVTFIVNDGFGSSNAASRLVNVFTVHFVITAAPSTTAGSAFTITVSARDQGNNPATGYTGTVHFTKTDSGVGSVVPADYTFVPGDLGSHTFTNGVTFVTAGSQLVTATDMVTAAITGSATVTVNPAAPNHLVFGQQPTNATAGAAISPSVTVRLLDPFNNLTTSTATVFVSAVGPGEFSGASTTSVAAVGGIATFSNLHLNTAGSYTIGVNSAGMSGATSNSFTISPAAADHLAFDVQPTTTTAGAAISPAVTVRVLDQFNNLTPSTASVSVATSFVSPGPFAPGSTTSAAAVGGVATFTNLRVNTIGTYAIDASSTGLTAAASNSFFITPAADAQLAFGQQPTNTTAGLAMSPGVTVRVLDQFGNQTSSTATVTVSATGPGPFSGASTTAVAAVSGVATFSNLRLNTAGSYQMSAGSGVLTGATSASFTINPAAADHLTVTAPPSTTAGTAFSITVTARDQFNNTATGYLGTVHFTTTDGQPSAVVPGDYTFVAADNGEHTFTNGVTLVTAGGQSVTATDTVTGTITGSASVTVTPAAANHFEFAGLSTVSAGSPFDLTVIAKDFFGNTATSYTGTVHFTKSDTGAGSVVPGDYTFIAADNGSHTFVGGVRLVTAGSQTVTATDTANAGINGTRFFTVNPAAAASFTISAPPAVNPGTPFTVTVTAKDAFNNVATGYAGTVHFTKSDINESAVVPPDYTFVAGDNGTHTFTNGVILQTAGGQTVTASDTVTGSITGTSNTITVNARPIVNNDNFTAVGNTEFRLGTGAASYPAAVMSGSVLDTDSDPDGNLPLTVVNVDTAGLQGSLTINPNGTFTFVPTVGFTGPTSFAYRAMDSQGNVSATTATVTITINNRVWFVDSAYSGGNGPSDGSGARPLTALTNLNGAGGSGDLDGPNDFIFVYQGTGSYGGGLEMEAGQKLYGQPFGLTVSGYTIVVAGGGSNPTITNAADAGIRLAEGVEVQRVNVANTLGDGITGPDGLNSATVGSNMSVTNAGLKGLRLFSGSGTVNFGASISGSGAETVSIESRTGGAVNVSGNIAGSGILIANNGDGTVSFSGDLDLTGFGISIINNATGSVTFSGATKSISTGTNDAVTIDSNGDLNVDFTNGGLAITTTGAGNGFSAAGGTGFVTVQGPNNTISTEQGIALKVEGMSIGGAGATFRSISAGTALAGPEHGIYLLATGAAGGLTITGSGTAGSGGTIRNTAFDGVFLVDTDNVNLNYLNVQDTGFDMAGIYASGVTGFALNNATISNSGCDGLTFDSTVSGNVTIANTTVSGSYESGLYAFLTSGTSNWTISNSTFDGSAADGISIGVAGGNVTATISGNTISNNSPCGCFSGVAIGALGSATVTATISGNNFTDNGHGIYILQTDDALLTSTISGNTMIDHSEGAISILQHSYDTSTGFLKAKVDNNTIGSVGVADSGSAAGIGIEARVSGNNTAAAIAIRGNTIREVSNNYAIAVYAVNEYGDSSTVDATISGNTVTAPTAVGAAPLSPIYLECDDGHALHADVRNNTTFDPNAVGGSGAAYELFATATATFTLFQTAAEAMVNLTPLAQLQATNAPTTPITITGTVTLTTTPVSLPPQLALGGQRYGGVGVPTITANDLAAILAEAEDRWAALGLSAADLARLGAVTAEIADLPDGYLGAAPLYGNTIYVDVTAAGYGWYVDPTPFDDSEFGLAAVDSPAAGRMDLLTVVMHELGHVLGLDSSYHGDPTNLMAAYLGTGDRRLPGAADVAALPTSVEAESENLVVAGFGTRSPGLEPAAAKQRSNGVATVVDTSGVTTFADLTIERPARRDESAMNWWDVAPQLRRAKRRDSFGIDLGLTAVE